MHKLKPMTKACGVVAFNKSMCGAMRLLKLKHEQSEKCHIITVGKVKMVCGVANDSHYR